MASVDSGPTDYRNDNDLPIVTEWFLIDGDFIYLGSTECERWMTVDFDGDGEIEISWENNNYVGTWGNSSITFYPANF